MDQNKTALERAFEIAQSGNGQLIEIRKQLLCEGYDARALEGSTLSKQLREIAQKVRAELEQHPKG